MKIGLLFGNFNPMHYGHVKLIMKSIMQNGIDKVVIVPRLYKRNKEDILLDIDERIEIIKLTLLLNKSRINNIPLYEWCEISDIDKEMIPPYYSYATLEALKNKYYGNEVYFICGENTYEDIKDWMHGDYILTNNQFIVYSETNESSKSVRNYAKDSNYNALNGLIPTYLIKRIIVNYK